LLDTIRRRASTRITLSAKNGVSRTKKRNCFSPTGTTLASVTALAVAFLGVSSMSAIFSAGEDRYESRPPSNRRALS
jgi:hypothetical protein